MNYKFRPFSPKPLVSGIHHWPFTIHYRAAILQPSFQWSKICHIDM